MLESFGEINGLNPAHIEHFHFSHSYPCPENPLHYLKHALVFLKRLQPHKSHLVLLTGRSKQFLDYKKWTFCGKQANNILCTI